MAYRSIAWLMSQAAAAPTANPTAGPSRRTCTENSAQSATPDASALATAIRIRSMGKTTTSLVPASMFRAWRTERGMRSLRTTSRRTTGSVEARMGPRTQREYRDSAGALHALVSDSHAFEAQDQGQRERGHRLQERIVRVELED